MERAVLRQWMEISAVDLNEEAALLMQVARQAAHDIRSPLSALNMLVASLSDLPEEKKFVLCEVIRRINHIANELLSASNGTISDRAESKQEAFELSDVLRTTVEEKKLEYQNRADVRIQADLDAAKGVQLMIDANEFRRVVSNLINNSVEAGARNITVRAKVESKGENSAEEREVAIDVIDDGEGFTKEVLACVESGGRARLICSKRKTGGCGLGLAHAKSAVGAMKGRLEIVSAENQGAKISMIFRA